MLNTRIIDAEMKRTALLRAVVVLFLMITAIYAHPATAQEGFEITLKSASDTKPLGPYSFITNRKPGSDTSENDIATKHIANERGYLQRSEILRIPTNYRQVWITFTVNNRTDSENWIIDFGNAMDGRMALMNKIKVYNHTAQETVEYGRGAPGVFYGPAIAITMKPHTENLFVVMFEGERGYPLTLSPKIISEDQYIKSLLRTNFFSAVLYTFFCLIILTYISILIQTRNIEFLGYALQYLFLAAAYVGLSVVLSVAALFIGLMIARRAFGAAL